MLNYKKAAAVNVKKTDYRYWQGLALEKLGKKAEAKALFEALTEAGKAGIVESYVNFYGAEGHHGQDRGDDQHQGLLHAGARRAGTRQPRDEARKCFAKSVELKPRQPLVVGDAPGVETINDCKNESSTNTDARRLRGRCPDRAAGPAAQKRPNMVVILADDCSWYDIGCYGAVNNRTPPHRLAGPRRHALHKRMEFRIDERAHTPLPLYGHGIRSATAGTTTSARSAKGSRPCPYVLRGSATGWGWRGNGISIRKRPSRSNGSPDSRSTA